MTGLEGFLADLAVVLCVAALSSVLFLRLRQPAVLGYLLAGLLIGPHVAQPLVSHHETVHTLSELGVILLMFSLGLEFSVRKLIELGVRAGLITAIDVSLMLWLGFLVGRAFGWAVPESLFLGAVVAISSTMLVARTFDHQKVGHALEDLVFGVLIFQDLLAILLIAVLSAVAKGEGFGASEVSFAVLRLVVFLLCLLVVGFLTIPRFLRFVVRSGHRETMLLATVGTSFAVALIAQSFGYSVALGAFLAATQGVAAALRQPPPTPDARLIGAVFCMLLAFYWIVYFRYFGRTAGMTWIGLRLLNFDAEPPTSLQRRNRAFGALLSAAALGVGFAWAAADEQRLCWHDRMSKTFVALDDPPA